MFTASNSTTQDQLYITPLPNGQSNGDLRLSVLLTPSLESATLPDLFRNWPNTVAPTTPTPQRLKWIVTFLTAWDANPPHVPVTPVISKPINPTIDPSSSPDVSPNLWDEIFRAVDTVNRRQRGNRLYKTWRLSHNISNLHERHQVDHLVHAYKQISARDIIAPESDFQNVTKALAPPPLFLHPEFGTDLALRFKDRCCVEATLKFVVAALPPKLNVDYSTVVPKRVHYAVDQLETYSGGAKLSAAALSAVYISCLRSAVKMGTKDPNVDAVISSIYQWFNGHFDGLADCEVPGDCKNYKLQPDYPSLDDVIYYVEMLLFHRRKSVPLKCQPIAKPDFHQLLGLVHNHPAIMRKLGLVFDFVITPNDGIVPSAGAAENRFSITVGLDTSDTYTKQVADQLVIPNVYTQCVVTNNDFVAALKTQDANLIQHGLLNLQAPSATEQGKLRFTLVPENADGQSLKRTDQVNNAARSTEYGTSAPTSMSPDPSPPAGSGVATPRRSVNPVTAPPAPRTVGLALFDRDRLANLEETVGTVPSQDDPPKTDWDFFNEDLILGYRVDILYKQRFFSLCRRDSVYDIYEPYSPTSPNSGHKIDTWKPVTQMELSADEGFLTFGATQSPLTDDGDTRDPSQTQTQIHQAVFTWTGWSLSIPQPQFPSMNPPQEQNCPDPVQSKHFALQPDYTLPNGFKLPPLRFNTDYSVRCRVVDLAGNSADPSLDPNNEYFPYLSLSPVSQFSRQEPIRAPQFLLVKPIDRVHEPGTHIDRLVARDNDAQSSRMLVPPRESLRLAELSGFLTNDKLPSTAFGDQQLWADGSFPSVACAKEKNWVDGTPDKIGDNDGIFLRKIEAGGAQNPYYPDPLANFIRVEAVQLTDDPNQSLLIDIRWISIGTKSEWPHFRPARIRLLPQGAGGDPTIQLNMNSIAGDRTGLNAVATLDVSLPEGCIVLLNISSANIDGSDESAAQDAYPVHLYNLSRSYLGQVQNNETKSLSSLFAVDVATNLNQIAQKIVALPDHRVHTPRAFVDGTLDMCNPKRTMTLVHAVKRPLAEPQFAPPTSPGYLRVVRPPGKPEAQISGQLRAHWLSTSKITCYAEWTDKVDDVSQPGPGYLPKHREVAFVITPKDLDRDQPFPATRLRALGPNLLQHFLDTRAHDVTYSLVATTNFREYYPGADDSKSQADEPGFQREGKAKLKMTVASSARPQAPKLLYLIPAFVWSNTYDKKSRTWYAGRTIAVRAYFERPMFLSGDRETIAVVLYDPHSGVDPGKQNYVCRWGADPTRAINVPILQNEMSEVNFCAPGDPIELCTLVEGGSARAKPCKIEYSENRRLWYTDIHINTQHSNSPFVTLAFVRWQPDALNASLDARCSQVVMAEFLQVTPDRWVSVRKGTGSLYTLTVSGVFDPQHPQCLTLTLYKRWQTLGGDTGWRKVDWPAAHPINFVYTPADSSGVSSWSTPVQVPSSIDPAEYRVFLTEEDYPDLSKRKSFSCFIDLK